MFFHFKGFIIIGIIFFFSYPLAVLTISIYYFYIGDKSYIKNNNKEIILLQAIFLIIFNIIQLSKHFIIFHLILK